MYKQGLMVKITNKDVLKYMRSQKTRSHSDIVESALRVKLGIPPKKHAPRTRFKLDQECIKAVGVKVSDPDLISHLLHQRKTYGINCRHSVESAILSEMNKK